MRQGTLTSHVKHSSLFAYLDNIESLSLADYLVVPISVCYICLAAADVCMLSCERAERVAPVQHGADVHIRVLTIETFLPVGVATACLVLEMCVHSSGSYMSHASALRSEETGGCKRRHMYTISTKEAVEARAYCVATATSISGFVLHRSIHVVAVHCGKAACLGRSRSTLTSGSHVKPVIPRNRSIRHGHSSKGGGFGLVCRHLQLQQRRKKPLPGHDPWSRKHRSFAGTFCGKQSLSSSPRKLQAQQG